MPELARKPGGSSLVQGPGDVRARDVADPGKRTLTEQLPGTVPGAQKGTNDGKEKTPHETTANDWSDAAGALGAAADIMSNRRSRSIDGVHSRYVPTLWKLYAAISGAEGGRPVSGAQRNAMFQEARQELRPAIDLYANSPDGKTWLEDYFYPEFNATSSSLAFSEAKDRVHNAVLLDPKHVVEIPSDGEPRKQGQVLHAELARLVPVMKGFNEQLIRMSEHEIMHEAKAMVEHGSGHGGKAGSLAELANVLMLADAWLILSDDEFKEHLGEIHGVFNGVSTYAELVKAVTELTGGAIGVTATAAAAIARATGNAAYANVASGIARKVGLLFADVVSGIEILHGLAVVVDPHATRQEKVDGAVDIAAGGAWFGGRAVGGAAVGFAASSAVLLGYAELKWALTTYWESSVGINTALMREAYEVLTMHGDSIARSADELAKAQLLAQGEKDSVKLESLKRVEDALARDLASSVDSLLADCGPVVMEAGMARKPGAYPILREVFAPLKAHRGAKSSQAAAAAGALALEKLVWARLHAADIVLESTRNRDLHAVEKDVAERERKSQEGHEGQEEHRDE